MLLAKNRNDLNICVSSTWPKRFNSANNNHSPQRKTWYTLSIRVVAKDLETIKATTTKGERV